jgi:hypothetical protein
MTFSCKSEIVRTFVDGSEADDAPIVGRHGLVSH